MDSGTTALFVMLDHDEAFAVADRAVVISGGRLFQVDEPSDEPSDRRSDTHEEGGAASAAPVFVPAG